MSSSPGQLPDPHPHPDGLPDALIARILTGLRDTQPSPGLNDRILHALQLHATEAPSANSAARRTLAIRRPWTVPALAAAFTTALLLAVVLIAPHPHRAPRTTAQLTHPQLTQPQLTPATPGPPPFAVISHQTAVILTLSNAKGKDPRISLPETKLHPVRLSRSCSKSPTPLAIAPPPTDPEAAEALAEANAPSHPAPPLPLTPQEKLLLRILQRNDPVELAQLDPLQRDATFARDQADYQKFFYTPPPPPPLPPPPYPTPDAPSTSGDHQ